MYYSSISPGEPTKATPTHLSLPYTYLSNTGQTKSVHPFHF